ncbi:hypothetical protein [Pseudomonas libanensis]|uniref:Phage protein n=1 Tax=Pseudomonas libanensis TaxID=75588 RepID=A0ABR5M0B2_9PSED|nr:hypothetical protein [Pseudomonas libanensis]KPG69102.1 hypothetical protein AEQ48_25010 [Pseudomonas libanensis]
MHLVTRVHWENNREAQMKICSMCKQSLPLDEFYRDSSRACGRRPACKACSKAGLSKAKQKAYYQANREARNAYGKAYYQANKTQGKGHAKRSLKRSVDRLDDTYIKQILVKFTTLKRFQIPQELVELKRLELSIKRKTKEMLDEER